MRSYPPNKALEPTPNSFRSCVAPAIGRGSALAFGLSQCKTPLNIEWVRCASGIMSSHGNHR